MEGVPTSYHPAIYSWMCMLCPFYAKSLHFESLWAVLVFWLFWVSVSAQTSYGLVRQARGYKEVHFAIPQFSAEDRNHAPRLDRSFAPTWTGHLQFQWVFGSDGCLHSPTAALKHLRRSFALPACLESYRLCAKNRTCRAHLHCLVMLLESFCTLDDNSSFRHTCQ